MYEAIPEIVRNDRGLMQQFVLGQLPPFGDYPGRIIADRGANIADLVGMVEGGFLTIEAITNAFQDPTPGMEISAHNIAVAVGSEIMRRHAKFVAAAGAAQLEADGVGLAWVVSGADDPKAAVASLGSELEWHLNGDELYVKGVTCAEVAAALQATRAV